MPLNQSDKEGSIAKEASGKGLSQPFQIEQEQLAIQSHSLFQHQS